MKDALDHSWIHLIWGRGRVNYKKHSLHHQSSNIEKFTFDLAIGIKLHTEQEPDNAVNKFTMKVVKNNETVGHLLCEYLRIFWYFIICSTKICMEVTGPRRHCKQLCGGMEIPCTGLKITAGCWPVKMTGQTKF